MSATVTETGATEQSSGPRLKARYRSEILPQLRDSFSIANVMQVPGVVKVVVNMGVGDAARDGKLHDLSDRQDCPSPRAMRLQNIYGRLIALGKILGEATVEQSEVWEVIADLTWTAFGTPMFSRRLDAGYTTSP